MLRHASLLTCGLLACVLALALGCRKPTLESVVAQIVEAQGGEKLKTIKSIKKSGKLVRFEGREGEMLKLVHFAVRPNKMRQEMSLRGAKIVQACDGTFVWLIDSSSASLSPRIIPKDQLNELIQSLFWVSSPDFDGPFVDSAEKGYNLELMMDEKLNGTPVHVVKVTNKRGKVETYYVDAESGLILKVRSKEKIQGKGFGSREFEIDTLFSDYKEVNGIMTAHAIDRFVDGQQVVQIVLDRVEHNVEVDDSLFKIP